MQTRPRPADSDGLNSKPAELSSHAANELEPTPRTGLVQRLNFGLALVVIGLAFVVVSKGWPVYSSVPGGRKAVLVGLGLVGLALGIARVGKQPGWAEVSRKLVRLKDSSRLREAVPVGLLVAVAYGMRVWGINAGLPYIEQNVEKNVAEHSLYIVQSTE